MARIVDFFDGAQSETTPTIGNIIASGIITYPDDATYEATEQNAPQAGNIYFNTTTNFLRYYNGSSWIDIVDDESLQTLVNKTIDADLNTITNIDNDEIKTGAGIDVTKLHDGSVDNTEFGHLDGVTSNIQTQLDSKQETSEKGQPNGYASLDGSGLVPSAQLPSFVDDVLEFADLASFPATGETGKLYVAQDTNFVYRWTGSQYVQVSNGVNEISDLTDVDASGIVDGQVLVYNGTSMQLEPGNIQNVIQENIALVGNGTATWTAGSGTSNVSVASSTTNTNDFGIVAGTEAGYTFTPSQSGPLQFVVGKFIDTGLANGDGIVQAKLYATSGGLPTGAAIATSNSFGTGSIPFNTEFDNNFIFSSNPNITAGTEYAITYLSTDTGTIFSRRGNVDEATSANVSQNASPPPDWELNPVQETIYHEVFVEVAATNSLVLSEDIFISIPGLEDSYHTIQAQTINIADGQAAHVTIDRSASSTTNLTVTVEDLTSVVSDNNRLVFLRAAGGEGYLGLHDPQRLEDGDETEIQKGGASAQLVFNASEWTDYTFNIGSTGGVPTEGTINIKKASWRRVGDSMEVKLDYRQTSAGSGGSGNYLFPLPAGFQIDTAKIEVSSPALFTNGNVGSASANINGTLGLGNVQVYDATNFVLEQSNNSSTNWVGSSWFALTGADVRYSFRATVPIQGWTATNTANTNELNLETVIVSARGNPGTHTASGSTQTVVIPTADVDNFSAYNTSTGIFTAPRDGTYLISYSTGSVFNSSGARLFQIFKNGVAFQTLERRDGALSGSTISSGTMSISLLAGETASLRYFQNSGGSLNYVQSTLSIQSLPDFTVFGVVNTDTEYLEITDASNIALGTTFGTYHPLNAAWSLTIPAGTWDIQAQASIGNNANAGRAFNTVVISTESSGGSVNSGNIVGGVSGTTFSDNSDEGGYQSYQVNARNVTFTTATTVYLYAIGTNLSGASSYSSHTLRNDLASTSRQNFISARRIK